MHGEGQIKPRCNTMSAAEWQTWPAAMKRSYVWGVVDTWSNVPGMSRAVNERRRSVAPYARLASCLGTNITYDQLYEMVEKYVADHPLHLNSDMTTIIWSAVNRTSPGQ